MNLVQRHFVFSTCCREHTFLLVKKLHGGFTEASWRLHGSITRLQEASRMLHGCLTGASRSLKRVDGSSVVCRATLKLKEFAVSGRARVAG